jgi:starch phosphorylase
MLKPIFKKETFKKEVKDEIRRLFRTTLEEATNHQIYQAVCYVAKDVIIDNWMSTQQAMKEQDPKIVYYMSMEFLTGRYLGNTFWRSPPMAK